MNGFGFQQRCINSYETDNYLIMDNYLIIPGASEPGAWGAWGAWEASAPPSQDLLVFFPSFFEKTLQRASLNLKRILDKPDMSVGHSFI